MTKDFIMKDVLLNGALLKVYRVVVAEEQPTIIFLHDSLGCIELWRDFPKRLGALTSCNVLVYDRQGYGQSGSFTTVERGNDYLEREADVLCQLIEQLGLKKVVLFGHSDGGSIALITAAKYPALIEGIITEGAHLFVEDITLAGIREAVTLYHRTNLKERLQKYHGEQTEAVFRAWTATWLSETFRTWNIEHFLPQIKCPVLVIQGAEDEYGSEAQVNSIVNQAGGRVHQLVIPGVGHTPHKEAGEVVLARAGLFIKQVSDSCDDE